MFEFKATKLSKFILEAMGTGYVFRHISVKTLSSKRLKISIKDD